MNTTIIIKLFRNRAKLIIHNTTRMHYSRMHTVRSSGRILGGGSASGMSAPGGCLLLEGVSAPGGVCSQGVCSWGDGGVCSGGMSTLGGVWSQGVSAPGGGGVCSRGVSAPKGSVCSGGGVSTLGGVVSSQHALR